MSRERRDPSLHENRYGPPPPGTVYYIEESPRPTGVPEGRPFQPEDVDENDRRSAYRRLTRQPDEGRKTIVPVSRSKGLPASAKLDGPVNEKKYLSHNGFNSDHLPGGTGETPDPHGSRHSRHNFPRVSKRAPARTEPPREPVVSYRSAAVGGDDFVYEVQRGFELVPDIEDELEEFSRLTRMGSFQKAKMHFSSHLRDHIGDPFVFVHYAEMLLEAGDFRSVVQLEEHAQNVFPALTRRSKSLYFNWRLIYLSAFTSSQRDMRKIITKVQELPSAILPRDPTSDLDSTQIRIFCLLIRLKSTHRTLLSHIYLPAHPSFWLDWGTVYQRLLKENRIWDFRDILMALCTCATPQFVVLQRIFFDSDDQTAFLKRIHDDWWTAEADASVHLALLEVFSLLAIRAMSYDQFTPFSSTAIALARPIGEAVLEKYPDQAITRPFLYWLLATATEQLFSQTKVQRSLSLHESPGPGLWIVPNRLGCGLPYYMPIRSDNPGWRAIDMPDNAKRAVEMVLSAARSSGDYSLQVTCLQELIDWSTSPALLLDELSQIQDQKQGDLYGHLGTCLSQFLLCETEDSKRLLRTKLANFGSWESFEWLPTSHILNLASRDVLLIALSSEDMTAFDTSIHAAIRFSYWLPVSVQHKIYHYVSGRSSRYPSPDLNREYDSVYVSHRRHGEQELDRRHARSNLSEKGSHERLRTQPGDEDRSGELRNRGAVRAGGDSLYGKDHAAPVEVERTRAARPRFAGRSRVPDHVQHMRHSNPQDAPPAATVGGNPKTPGREYRQSDPEFERMKAQLQQLQLEKAQAEEAKRQADMEKKIRDSVEREFQERMAAMQEAQEVAKKEIEVAKKAAEAAALERLREEHRIEEERRRMEAELKAQAAREERERIENERREEERRLQEHALALGKAEDDAREKYKAALAAEEERKLEMENQRLAIEAQIKEKLLAEQKAAEACKELADEAAKQQATEDYEAKMAEEKKAAEDQSNDLTGFQDSPNSDDEAI